MISTILILTALSTFSAGLGDGRSGANNCWARVIATQENVGNPSALSELIYPSSVNSEFPPQDKDKKKPDPPPSKAKDETPPAKGKDGPNPAKGKDEPRQQKGKPDPPSDSTPAPAKKHQPPPDAPIPH